MGNDDFLERLDAARAALPANYRRLLDEIALLVVDRPEPGDRRAVGTGRREHLYGLYDGAGIDGGPARIVLYREALEADFGEGVALSREIRRTLLHELGHHLGYDDAQLDALGLG